MAFLFSKVLTTVGDDQAEVADAGLIDSWIINLIEDAVTEREPNLAVEIQCGAYACLGARSPAGGDPGPARRVTNFITHEALSLTFKQFARRFRSALGFHPERRKGQLLAPFPCIRSAHQSVAYMQRDFPESTLWPGLTRLEKKSDAKYLGNQVRS
jgi:hypothetical protein